MGQIMPTVGFMLVALLPAFMWLLFFIREDSKREPMRLIFKTFFFGALVSVPVLGLQIGAERLLSSQTQSFFVGALVLAFFEELFKFFAAYFAVHKEAEFDEPIDAMIYAIVAGLGFATIENIFVVASVAFEYKFGSTFLAVSSAMLLRFIGATLLHTLACAVIGYFWAKGILRGRIEKFVFLGIAIATIIHAVFNTLVYNFQEVNFLIPIGFLIAVSFFVFRDFEKLK